MTLYLGVGIFLFLFFHEVTSLHPPSFHRNDFSTCSTHFSLGVCAALVSFPDPHVLPREKYLTSDFLVVLSQHAYGNFVMQRDSHMTAVARARISSARCTAHTSKKEELLLIARVRRSAWKIRLLAALLGE